MLLIRGEKQKWKDQQRNKFIPFANERDEMGKIVRPKTTKTKYQSYEILENLKKTTQQYFFDKHYQKLLRKQKQINAQINTKQYDYQSAVQYCLKNITPKQPSDNKCYMELEQQLNKRIKSIKNKRVKYQSQIIKLNKSNKSNYQQQKSNRNNIYQKNSMSQFMHNFTEYGKKYKKNISKQKMNSWSKWYQVQYANLLPGKVIKFKQFKKSLYDTFINQLR